jgi:hypothetical protein
MKKDNRTATTVKLTGELYYNFKVEAMKQKLSLQEFVEKCVTLYVSNEPHSASFRDLINEFKLSILSTTGSFGSQS